jgi:tRNA/tmRNA/rRNA uracil-C5-methylase (TrmA/RlmC/RlmD family)
VTARTPLQICGLTGAKRVVGLELCADAVQDAKLNAVANSVTNCQFEVGRAEDTIPKVCAAHLSSTATADSNKVQHEGEGAERKAGAGKQERGQADGAKEVFGSCVAILDPPREGVHWKVIR